MILISILLVPLLALGMIGFIFVIGASGLAVPSEITESEQSAQAQAVDSLPPLGINPTQPIAPMPIADSHNPALNLTTTKEQIDYEFNSLIINV